MAQTSTHSATYSWTEADVSEVVTSFYADLKMIAQSTDTWDEKRVDEVAHDVDLLARLGYLSRVHILLLIDGVKERAAVYAVNEDASSLISQRPGGVRWPKGLGASLRGVLSYTKAYDDAAEAELEPYLKRAWSATSLNTDHSDMSPSGNRAYSQNGWGLERQDYSR